MCYCITWALVSCFMDDPAKGEWWLLHSRILKYECNSFWFVLFYILYLLTNSCWYSGWYCDVQLRWNLLGIVILEFPLWINLITFRIVLYYYCLVSHGCVIECLVQWINTQLKLCSKCMGAYCLYKPALGPFRCFLGIGTGQLNHFCWLTLAIWITSAGWQSGKLSFLSAELCSLYPR